MNSKGKKRDTKDSVGCSTSNATNHASPPTTFDEKEMSDYWLISVPCDNGKDQVWETLNNATNKHGALSINYKFAIPNLKVSTLDQLLTISDDLAKLDIFVEQVAKKVARYLGEVLEDQRNLLRENLVASNVDLHTYLTRFQWDNSKYPTTQPLKITVDVINRQISLIDSELQTRSSNYNSIKSSLKQIEKNQSASLLTRNLVDIIKKEDVILDSEYLMTLVVAVPKSQFQEWNKTYERLCDMVVPRSSKLIQEDDQYGLFTVCLFKKAEEEFKKKAREHKFTVREFIYDEEEIELSKSQVTNLLMDKKKQFGPLVRWLKVNFSEAFCAWIHIKALRVFVESVLRYGLPVNFQSILLHPYKKTEKKLRDILNHLYADLDRSHFDKVVDNSIASIPGVDLDKTEYYPYVYYKININMV